MHARIYQLTKEKLNKEDYITPDMFDCPNETMDYARETETYDEDVNALVEHVLPKICFTKLNEQQIRYNGGLMEFADEWINSIKKLANSLEPNEKLSYDMTCLSLLIKHPTDTHSLICCTDENGYRSVYTVGEWIHTHLFLNDLKPLDTFFVGGILDFHY